MNPITTLAAPNQNPWPVAPASAEAETPAAQAIFVPVRFVGDRFHYLWLALKTTFWTLLTVGIYRFWMKTRQRRFLWSSVQPGGFPLEYHGEPWEKLLGFLAAVCLLSFYIGVVNLILFFASFILFEGDYAGYWLSFLGILPLFWAAKYRARRYLLARSSWRGIRFGAEPGAWAYARAAVWNWFLTILTLGYLWPRMTFMMEKFRIDRTLWGDQHFHQGGNWKMLRRHMRPIWVMTGVTAALFWWIWNGNASLIIFRHQSLFVIGVLSFLASWVAAFVIYRTNALRTMANHKTLGSVKLASAARPWRIVRHYLWGSVLLTFFLGLVVTIVTYIAVNANPELAAYLSTGATPDLEQSELWTLVGVGLFLYFSLFVLLTVLTQLLITFPNFRHYAETLSFTESDFAGVMQRPPEDIASAEGIADALDLGAAF
jgi:uncharacterized membrane protein YjgN (DUF898 family)